MKKTYRFCTLCLGLMLFAGAVGTAWTETRFALVQYEVERDVYRDAASFQADIEGLVEAAVRGGAECIIFPEYTNVFLSVLPLADELDAIDSMDEGLALIQQLYGEDVGLREYFIRQSPEVRRIMDGVWGNAAERYGIWIVAGTAFIAGDGSSGAGNSIPGSGKGSSESGTGSTGAGLYNRLFVYGPEGEVIYAQDKVYLTPFERDVAGLDSGRLGDAELIEIGDTFCGFSICRDTFFDVWEARLGGADLWVDVKANGAEFTAETEELFATALPERIRNTGVRYGATVCLTGEFLELFWEGRSSVVTAAAFPQGYETVLESRDHIGEEILFFTVNGAE